MGFFNIFSHKKMKKLWVRNRSHPEFCGDPERVKSTHVGKILTDIRCVYFKILP